METYGWFCLIKFLNIIHFVKSNLFDTLSEFLVTIIEAWVFRKEIRRGFAVTLSDKITYHHPISEVNEFTEVST